MLKCLNVAMSASSLIAPDVSGRSLDISLPRYRIVIENFVEAAPFATIF